MADANENNDDFLDSDVPGLRAPINPNEREVLLATSEKLELETSPQTEDDVSYWRLWKHHTKYRWYLLSSLVTDAGEWFSYIASISAIEEIHASNNEAISRTSISILVALRLLPNALFSNIGGVLADSYDRRNMLLILDVLGAIMALFFIVAYYFRSIWGLYATTVCQMTVAAMYEPARSALVPMLLSNEGYLKKALTLTGLTWSVMACVGASAGGFVTEYFGISKCFLLDSATYLMSACFIWRIRGSYVAVPSKDCDQEDEDISISSSDAPSHILSISDVVKMTTDGFKYLQSKPWGAFVFLKGCAGLIYGAAEILNVAFSERSTSFDGDINLEGSSRRLGIIFASVGVGCFIGPIISDTLTDMEKPRSLEGACLASYLLMGIGSLGLAHIKGFPSVCLFSAIRAAGSSVIWIYSSLLLQKFSSTGMLGRVMALDYAIATFSEAVAAMIGGLLIDKSHMLPESVSYIMAMVAVATSVLWSVYFCIVRE